MLLNAAKVNRTARHPTEERGKVSRAHYHLKGNATKRVAVKRADFNKAKRVFFYTTIEYLTKYVIDFSLRP